MMRDALTKLLETFSEEDLERMLWLGNVLAHPRPFQLISEQHLVAEIDKEISLNKD